MSAPVTCLKYTSMSASHRFVMNDESSAISIQGHRSNISHPYQQLNFNALARI